MDTRIPNDNTTTSNPNTLTTHHDSGQLLHQMNSTHPPNTRPASTNYTEDSENTADINHESTTQTIYHQQQESPNQHDDQRINLEEQPRQQVYQQRQLPME
jgi:hypothetical protein